MQVKFSTPLTDLDRLSNTVQPAKHASNNTSRIQPGMLVLLQILPSFQSRQGNAPASQRCLTTRPGPPHCTNKPDAVAASCWLREKNDTHTQIQLCPQLPLAATPGGALEGALYGSSPGQTVNFLCAITGSSKSESDAALCNFIVDQSKLLGLPCLLLPLVHHDGGNYQRHKCQQAHYCDSCLATLRLGAAWQGLRGIPAQTDMLLTDRLLSNKHYHGDSVATNGTSPAIKRALLG